MAALTPAGRSPQHPDDARYALARLVAVVSVKLALGLATEEVLRAYMAENAELEAMMRATDAEAEAWFDHQAQTLRPRQPRNTAAKRQQALLAHLAARRR